MIKNFWNKLKSKFRRSGETQSSSDPVERILNEPSSDDRMALVGMAKAYVVHLRQERERELRWQRIRRSVLLLLMLSGAMSFWWRALQGADFDWRFWRSDDAFVGVVELQGAIAADGPVSADRVVAALNRAAQDETVRTIALYIDSPGGQPAEAERIAEAIDRVRQEHGKPIVAVGGNVVASAAYLVALHADRIIVPSYSLVGSIGAVIPSWDVSGLLKRLDIEHRSYASGPYKAMLSPFEPQTPAAQDKAQALVDQMAGLFAERVEAKRGTHLKRDVKELATGEVWSGREALAVGLADANGTLEAVLSEDASLKVKNFGGSRSGGLSQWLRTELRSWLFR